VCVCVRERESETVCVCVRERERESDNNQMNAFIHTLARPRMFECESGRNTCE